ncbi:hypothetical protein O0I10_004393 [Lichtheimia ornata]|uniref:Cytochrome p450 n=1 Tax=Lichtheimia ornata TaxID=688661 RepID=A0AAD7V6M9_9FUNG|nr:uncharacterized protein O0I10_004393 [Lichtheimia ornata]KAJ8659800.1 hypothetical protein O0I10_004393 [Lichtheimia ornata]
MPIVSTLAQRANTWLLPGLERIIHVYSTVIMPHLRQRKAFVVPLVAMATVTLALYRFYRKISRPPASLSHLPYCDFWTTIKYYMTNGLVQDYSRQVILPTLAAGSGVFARFSPEGWIVDIADPIAAKQMLLKTDNFPKSETTMGVQGTLIERYVGGPNIVFLNGHDWKRHRKIANPAFHRAFPVKLFGTLAQNMFKAVDDDSNGKINVLDIFTRLTLDAIGTAGFGFNFNALEDKDNKWVSGYNSIREGMVKPLYILMPIFDTKFVHLIPDRQKAHDNLTDFLNMLDTIINDKREQIAAKKAADIEDHEKDLLTLMIESEMNPESEGAVMSNEELKSNLCIFFLAGHDTTAFALSCAIYELAKNQDVQEKARQEVIRILGDESCDVLPTVEQTKQMTYLNTIIKETLRLHNPLLTMTTRTTVEDCELGGVFIPKDTKIDVDIYNLHRSPRVWSNPDEFIPDRYAPGGEAERQPGSGLAWVPFSNGGRQCIGMNFSLAQQRVVLAMLLRKYTFELPKDTIHKNDIQKRGIIFGMITIENLDIVFNRRY